MGKIVSNFGKGIPKIFRNLISNCNAFSAACRPVREAYTSQARREIGEFGAVPSGESSKLAVAVPAPGSRPIAFDVRATLTSSSNW